MQNLSQILVLSIVWVPLIIGISELPFFVYLNDNLNSDSLSEPQVSPGQSQSCKKEPQSNWLVGMFVGAFS